MYRHQKVDMRYWSALPEVDRVLLTGRAVNLTQVTPRSMGW